MRDRDDRGDGNQPAEQNPIVNADAFAHGDETGNPMPVDVGPGGDFDFDLSEVMEEGDEATPVEGGEVMSVDALRGALAHEQDRFLRLAAEYDNFRRRSLRERQEAGARGQAELVKSLLEPFDDLDRFANVDPASTTASIVVEGVAMVERKMARSLTAAGLEIVNPMDAPFDPNLHEAVATTPAASPAEDSTISQVYQLGYVFAGQLLRPARVVVRQWQG